MAKVDKKIYFSGDSFTYGEGLELYTPTDKWRKELYNLNTWSELRLKLDNDSEHFRKKNNFVGLFSSKFPTYKVYQHNGNGGSLSYDLHKRLIPEISEIGNVDCIIIQFTTFSRNCLHLNYECTCDFCKNTGYRSVDSIINAISSIHDNRGIDETDVVVLNEFYKLINYNKLKSYEILEKYELFYKDVIQNQIKIFKDDYLSKFIESGIKVFFIDSWDDTTSYYLQQDSVISNLTIPLKSKDGNYYKSWSEFISKFEKPWIYQNYEITANHHPTPEVHSYISESLIDFFNKNNVFS